MPNCPKCGALLDEDAAFCSKCGSALRQQLTTPPSPRSTSPPSAPSYPPARDMARTYAILGFISAVLSLLIVPELFGSAAIVVGAYTWRKKQGNLGLIVLILGIICMIVGIEVPAPFWLGGLLPS